MKAAIIFIAGKIRQGQFPKLPGFAYSEEYGKYLYGGGPIPLDEFNAAAEVALDPSDRRFSISVRVVDVSTPKAAAKIAIEIPAESPAESPAEIPAEEEAPKEEPKAPTAADIIAAKKAAHKTSTP